MSKYVLDVNSGIAKNVIVFGTLGERDISTVFKIDELEELNNDYINKHYDFLQNDAYQRGLNDAWEAARKIVLDDGIDMNTLCTIFGRGCIDSIIKDYSASEAIKKLKTYEEQKINENVKYGDVIRNKINGLTYIVTSVDNCGYVLLGSNGNCSTTCCINTFEKTGKHFDLDKILEEMKE